MKLELNKAHYPVTALGPGRRIGIWMQGCSIHCPGCVSRDTWKRDRGKSIGIADLMAWCKRVCAGVTDGVTISGGEPFDQPQALAALLDALAHWRKDSGQAFDILCYSGYRLEKLQRRHPRLLERIDALVCDPYVERLPSAQPWRGSDNQRLVPLTPLGRQRYAPYLDGGIEVARRFQVVADGKRLWFVGIPQRGDLDRIEQACAERGVSLAATSWRA